MGKSCGYLCTHFCSSYCQWGNIFLWHSPLVFNQNIFAWSFFHVSITAMLLDIYPPVAKVELFTFGTIRFNQYVKFLAFWILFATDSFSSMHLNRTRSCIFHHLQCLLCLNMMFLPQSHMDGRLTHCTCVVNNFLDQACSAVSWLSFGEVWLFHFRECFFRLKPLLSIMNDLSFASHGKSPDRN